MAEQIEARSYGRPVSASCNPNPAMLQMNPALLRAIGRVCASGVTQTMAAHPEHRAYAAEARRRESALSGAGKEG